MHSETLREFTTGVQHNCHVSDAHHGADYSLCAYLMKMREYYRWEKQLPYGATLRKEQVGAWLAAREQLWEALENAEFSSLHLDGESFDPFDSDGLNAHLEAQGLVYSGGLGRGDKPHFVLGKLEGRQRQGGCSVFLVGEEYARDLGAPPAMTQGEQVFVRRESLRRMLWETLEGWRWSRPDNALGRALASYDFEHALESSLEAMTEREIGTLLWHEQGEHEAGRRLGDDWNRMLGTLACTPAEHLARAVRDHLADCLVTLPALVEAGEAPSLHFFMGHLAHLRKEIFPGLAQAYEEWRQSGDTESLSAIAALGAVHWERLARELLALYREGRPDAPRETARRFQELVAECYL